VPQAPKSQALKDWILPGTKWASNKLIMGQPDYERLKYNIEHDDNHNPRAGYEASQVLASLDRKYAITGTHQSGPLEIRMPPGLFRCQIWIFEPQRPWGGHRLYDAYFPDEYEFSVNNKSCVDSDACKLYSNPDIARLHIDARSLVGKSCRTEEVILSISVKTMKVEDLDKFCINEQDEDKDKNTDEEKGTVTCKPKRDSLGERTEGFSCVSKMQNGKSTCVYGGQNRKEEKVTGSIFMVMAN